MDVDPEIGKTPKKVLKSMTTTNLRKNILVQGGLVAGGAIASEYASSFVSDLVAKTPVPPEYSGYIVPVITGIGSVFGMAAFKNYYARMVLFGVLGQSMLSLVRIGLSKLGAPAPAAVGATLPPVIGTKIELF